jgi:hypothetical protein
MPGIDEYGGLARWPGGAREGKIAGIPEDAPVRGGDLAAWIGEARRLRLT